MGAIAYKNTSIPEKERGHAVLSSAFFECYILGKISIINSFILTFNILGHIVEIKILSRVFLVHLSGAISINN